jgi:hypothetical protein
VSAAKTPTANAVVRLSPAKRVSAERDAELQRSEATTATREPLPKPEGQGKGVALAVGVVPDRDRRPTRWLDEWGVWPNGLF